MIASRRLALGLVTAVMASGLAFGTGLASAAVATCKDFQYQEDAQAAYNAGNRDLDGNDQDGKACESLPHRPSGSGSGGAAPTSTTTTRSTTTSAVPPVNPPVVIPPTSSSTTTTTTTKAPTTPRTPDGRTVDDVIAFINSIGCAHYERDTGQAFDDYFALIPAGASQADLGRILDAITARTAALNYCVGVPGDYTPVGAVTSDDGSTADTSGTQVTEVPEGYARTGGL